MQKNKDRTWGEYYRRRFSYLEMLIDVILHIPYLLFIMFSKNRRILEVGGGTGYHSFFLNKILSPRKHAIVDKDIQVLKMLSQRIKKKRYRIRTFEADAFDLPFKDKEFDLSISQGFFEHFNEEEIAHLIDEQLRVAKKIIFSVPSKYYYYRDFGNERLYTKNKWKNILRKYDSKVLYYFPDLSFRNRINLIKPFLSGKVSYRYLYKSTQLLVVIKNVKK